jgi:uncharacterized OB-fold protein
MEIQAAKCRQQQDEFTEYMDRVKDDIDAKSERFKYVEYYEATLRDAEAKEIAVSTDNIQDLEDRRKDLLAINAYTAVNAELPPTPQVSENMMEDFSLNLIKEVDQILEKYREMDAKGIDDYAFDDLSSDEGNDSADHVEVADETEQKVDAENSENALDENSAEDQNFVFCSECGAKLEAGIAFCTECGAKIEAEAETDGDNADADADSDNADTDASADADQDDGSTDSSDESEASVRFCSECGAKLAPGTLFCEECGTKVDGEEA